MPGHVVLTILLLSLYSLSYIMANYQINGPKFNWDAKDNLLN